MRSRLLYFDLGNVLLHFDHRLGCRQMAEVAGVSPEAVWDVVFAGDLQHRYELGELSTGQFYDAFCQATGTCADRAALEQAAGAIFRLNQTIVPLVGQLRAAGYRMGILSNTCDAHWKYVHATGRYRIIDEAFSVFALSFELGAMKPDAAIFRRAAELAQVAPEEIFYVDDIAGHVAGARAAGFDAVQYTSTVDLGRALYERGVVSAF